VRERVKDVAVSDEVYSYVGEIVLKTRSENGVRIGASPRSALALIRCSQAVALVEGYDYVSPGHVFNLIKPVLAHRIVLSPDAKLEGKTAEDILDSVILKTPTPIRKQG
jgi:MoxR-like ATPase